MKALLAIVATIGAVMAAWAFRLLVCDYRSILRREEHWRNEALALAARIRKLEQNISIARGGAPWRNVGRGRPGGVG